MVSDNSYLRLVVDLAVAYLNRLQGTPPRIHDLIQAVVEADEILSEIVDKSLNNGLTLNIPVFGGTSVMDLPQIVKKMRKITPGRYEAVRFCWLDKKQCLITKHIDEEGRVTVK